MGAPLLARLGTAPTRRRLRRRDPDHPMLLAWTGFWQHVDDLDTISAARIALGGDRRLRVEPPDEVGALIPRRGRLVVTSRVSSRSAGRRAHR